MKIFGIERAAPEPVQEFSCYIVADSAAVPWRKPCFVPDFADDFRLRPVVAVRIDRLGKGIAPKFASRYYNMAALGYALHAEDLRRRLAGAGEPQSAAVSFDGSLCLGAWQPFAGIVQLFDAGITCRVGAEEILLRFPDLTDLAARAISFLSNTYTLKTGDILFFHSCAPACAPSALPGEEVTFAAGDDALHSFTLR